MSYRRVGWAEAYELARRNVGRAILLGLEFLIIADIVLTITDEGTGIETADVEQVFGRFYRGENARRLHVPGTGLGLTIVRSIVEAHGGVVSLESTLGEGTSVCVLLPR